MQGITGGVDHVGLSVSNLDASSRFFIDTLGWTLRGEDPDYPARFVTDGTTMVTLWQVSDPQTAVAFNRKTNVGLHHLAIRVNSFEALDQLYQRMLKNPDVVIEFAPELSYGGPARHMMIREPGGNRMEFIHRPGG